ncbi:MAG: hypothetical protein EHM16_09630 [Betaproteobacteria bacterium]|nr:MAG: hypothetical protein EHM16_09630 [Betaproteobacteria bacterium]
MIIARRTQARAMRCVGIVLLILALPAAYAQYTRLPDIQIPDFRHAPPPAAARAGSAETCATCGVITAIRETQSQRPVAVPQGFQNAPLSSGPTTDFRVGAVVALPMSESANDRAFVGGVGTPEMRARFSESNYEITVRLDNGAYSVVQRRDGGRFRVGDRVRMRGIELELLGR